MFYKTWSIIHGSSIPGIAYPVRFGKYMDLEERGRPDPANAPHASVPAHIGELMNARRLVPALTAVVLLACTATAAEDLVLNGSGVRTKPILGVMYDLSLHLPAQMKGAHPKAIIEDGRPMELVLTLRSSMINRARFVEATSGGFAKAAESGYAADQTGAFLDQFANTEFRKGDSISMRYENGGLVTTYRKTATKQSPAAETRLGRIPGLELKQALFAIWLGDAPVQNSLKQGLLGKP
jgi:hypothetical protein